MIKFYASIPKSYIKSVPPGRYLLNAAQFWRRAEPDQPGFQLPSLPRDGYTWMIDSGGYQFRDGYPKGYIDKYVQFIQALQPDFAVFPDVMGDAQRTLELFEYTDKMIDETLKTVWLPVIQGDSYDILKALKTKYIEGGYLSYSLGGLKKVKDFTHINHFLNNFERTQIYFNYGCNIHLLGAGLRILKKLNLTGQNLSCDSGNFNQRFGKNIQKCNDYMRLNNCTQKQAVIDLLLPDYIKKVEEL